MTNRAIASPAAALVSDHRATRRRVAQSLGAAGLRVRAASFPSELPIEGFAGVEALLVDLDVAPSASPRVLVEQARRGYPGVPVIVVAGIDARARLLAAFCDADVDHVLPKPLALALPEMTTPGALDGPNEHDLFAAARRLLDGPASPGITPYLLARAPVHACTIHDTTEKERALDELMAFADALDLGGEKLRRIELAADELLMNALYGAPCGADGIPRFLPLDRRLSVSLDEGESIQLRYGCDGRTFAVAVADPFGSLTKRRVTERLRAVATGVPGPVPGVAGAGLGLVMAYTVANQLIFSVSPGTLTEVTAVLHVAGTNRASQERGTAVHFFRTAGPSVAPVG